MMTNRTARYSSKSPGSHRISACSQKYMRVKVLMMSAVGMVTFRMKKMVLQKGILLVSPIQKKERDEKTRMRTKMMGR